MFTDYVDEPVAFHTSSSAANRQNKVDSEVQTDDVILAEVQLQIVRQKSEKFQVSDCSWNSTGSVIAASYGHMDHEHWCSHKSFICSWNVDRRNINKSKPDLCIQLQSCVTCLEFHPTLPSVIAGGNFLGEVLVWDLSRADDPLVGHSSVSGDMHKEPVSCIRWIVDEEGRSRGKHLVISSGLDGRMFTWRIEKSKPELQLVKRFLLKSDQLPRSVRTKIRNLNSEIGITDVALSSEDPEQFVASTESGVSFTCSTESNQIVAQSEVEENADFYNPSQLAILSHDGPVYCVQALPFFSKHFLSGGTDGQLKINSVAQVWPLLSFEPACGPIFSISCSPSKPGVIAVACENSVVLVFDLVLSRSMPQQRLDVSSGAAVYTVQFNKNQPRLLAAGDSKGQLHVWNLDDSLTTAAPKEADTLQDIFVRENPA